MAYQFIRQEPCYDHILFVLALDRDKMKERILIGTEQQIRFRLDGNKDNDVIYDITRPLGRFLIDFEYDKEKEEKKLRKAEYEYGREQGREEGREEGRIEGERSGRTHLLTLISQMSAGEDADKVTQLTDPEVLEAMMKKYGIE